MFNTIIQIVAYTIMSVACLFTLAIKLVVLFN